MTNWWQVFISQINSSTVQIRETAGLFWDGLVHQLSLISIIDAVLVFALLWWIYRKLRRSELIKIFPKVFLLLVFILLARVIGLWAVVYVTSAILIIVLLAIGALYAPDIKHILELDIKLKYHPRALMTQVSTGDIQSTIKTVIEALAVLTRAQKPALIIIKKDRPLTRLVENGTKMNSLLKPDLLIDFFTSGSELSKGAVVIEHNKIVAAGSTLFRPHTKILFNPTNPLLQRVAKELGAVVVVSNKTAGDIGLIHGEHSYKNLELADLSRLLQNILVYRKL